MTALFATALSAAAVAPAAATAATPQAAAPGADYDAGPAVYTDSVLRDQPIVMRDGITLRADVHRPADPATGQPAPGPFPVLVSETPYGKQLGDFGETAAVLSGYEAELVKRGYIQVIVDVRGSGGSEGTFDLLSPTEQQDSVEVIDWASKVPNSTGKVGMTGLSYVGITQLLAAAKVGAGSPLKAIFPMMATNDPYRELATDGGLFNLTSIPAYAALVDAAGVANPLLQIPRSPTDALILTGEHGIGDTYWSGNTLAQGLTGGDPAYDQDYWRSRSPGANLDKIVANGVAAFLVGGAYDVFQAGEVNNFVGLQNAAAGKRVEGPLQTGKPLDPAYQLIVGPWYHLSGFEGFDVHAAQLAWFDHWLKGKDTGITEPAPAGSDSQASASRSDPRAVFKPLHVIEPGGDRYDAGTLPVPGTAPTKLYLGDASLSEDKPTATDADDTIAYTGVGAVCTRALDQWSTGIPTTVLRALKLKNPCASNRPFAPNAPGRRSYTTEALASDLRIAGPSTLTLQASSTTKDAEFVVTLQDVDPGGRATDLTSGALLGSHRAVDTSQSWPGVGGDPLLVWHPFTKAALKDVPRGELTRFDVPIRPTFTSVPKGHRLRVVLTTSDLPHLLPIPADLLDLAGGIYSVQRTAAKPSFLQLAAG